MLIKPKVRGDIKHVPTLVTEQQFLVTCYLLVIKTLVLATENRRKRSALPLPELSTKLLKSEVSHTPILIFHLNPLPNPLYIFSPKKFFPAQTQAQPPSLFPINPRLKPTLHFFPKKSFFAQTREKIVSIWELTLWVIGYNVHHRTTQEDPQCMSAILA